MGFKSYWSPKDGKSKAPLTPSQIPPRDWKYWCMVALSLAWFVLLTIMLWRSNYVPSVNQWWKDQVRLERLRPGLVPPFGSHSPQEKLSGSKVPFPKEGEYFELSFDALAGFPSELPDISAMQEGRRGKKPTAEVPDPIRSLDGQKISVAGFMIPMTVEKDSVSCFILAQSRMTCCYGAVPKLNQWIFVIMGQGRSAKEWMDVPVTVFGTIDVGPKYDEDNKGWCLYRMTGDRVDLPKKSWF